MSDGSEVYSFKTTKQVKDKIWVSTQANSSSGQINVTSMLWPRYIQSLSKKLFPIEQNLWPPLLCSMYLKVNDRPRHSIEKFDPFFSLQGHPKCRQSPAQGRRNRAGWVQNKTWLDKSSGFWKCHKCLKKFPHLLQRYRLLCLL